MVRLLAHVYSDNGSGNADADAGGRTGRHHSHMPVCHTCMSDLLGSDLESFFGRAPLRQTLTLKLHHV